MSGEKYEDGSMNSKKFNSAEKHFMKEEHMRKGILIKTNNTVSVVELPEDDTFNDEVYKLLNCSCWEGVVTDLGFYMLVDENGKITEPPKKINALATAIYPGYLADYIAGDALILKIGKNADGESDLVSLSDTNISKLLFALQEMLNIL